MFDIVRNQYSDLSRGNRRLLIALLLFIDANFLGTLNGYGTLNLLDLLIGDGLPDDLVWILQIVQSISAGFIVVKVLFDDIPSGASRTTALNYPITNFHGNGDVLFSGSTFEGAGFQRLIHP